MSNQLLPSIESIIKASKELFKQTVEITQKSSIPDTQDIPIANPKKWLRIEDVICIFVDMKGSTLLSASKYDKSTASAYQLYTGTGVRIFHDFESPYIDVRGDGVLALFDSDKAHTALAAAVTFKTFANTVFKSLVSDKTELDIGSHMGIDIKTLLVKKIGLKSVNGRTDRNNEVWAGRPVNMAAKLSSLSNDNELLISDRFFNKLKSDAAIRTCGCPNDEKVDLWEEKDLSDDDRFDFNKAYSLGSNWCTKHGKEYCQILLDFDID